VLCEGRVNKRFLAIECLNGATACLSVIVETRISNFRVKFDRRSQAKCCPAIPLIERFAKDELPAICIVAKIKPVGNRAPFPKRITNHCPCCPCIHASQHNVSAEIITRITAGDESPGLQVNGDCFPFEPPEQVKPVDQDNRLVEADLRPGEWLA